MVPVLKFDLLSRNCSENSWVGRLTLTISKDKAVCNDAWRQGMTSRLLTRYVTNDAEVRTEKTVEV